ncbi:hypothetical protein F4811DRAFT_165154 [Daldinia bambusicola]|nr:hypothetical protein F4811DRAFT_165154 [Daldinia bambusicola]
MSTMLSTNFNFKRTWLQALFWTRLLFQSLCDNNVWTGGSTSELGIFGSPALHISTITITTTLAYNPAIAPQDSMFSLLGCYSRGAGPPGGNLFGTDDDYVIPTKVPPDKLTISACLEACTALDPPKKTSDHYGLVGLSNGSECFCGLELVAEARKLTLGACDMPCTGDSALSCGGRDTVAVYRFITASESNTATSKGNSQDDSSSSGEGDESKTAPLGASLSSVIDTSAFLKATDAAEPTETETLGDSQGTTGKAAIPSSPPLPPSESSDLPDQSAKGPTIAAVTGSVSGAIILAGFIFLCVKHYKRKKLQQAAHHTEVVPEKQQRNRDNDKQLPRRPIPSAIDTTGHQQLRSEAGPERAVKDDRGHAKRDEDLTYLSSTGTSTSDGAYFVPTTPALESGTRLRHPEHASARLATASSPSSGQDTLYNRLMDEVRSGPAIPAPSPSPSGPLLHPPPQQQQQQPPSSATSSAVQWRNQPPLTPSAASAGQFNFDFSNTNNNSNTGVKTSTVPAPVPVPPAARPEATLGDRAWHRRKVSTTFQPPASGPPSMPLPPTPPRRPPQQQQQRYAELARLSLTPTPTPAARRKAGGSDGSGGGGKKKGPRASAVPRELRFGDPEVTGQGASTRRMSAPQSPALKDSPTMPPGRRDSQYPRGAGTGVAQGGVGEEVGMQPLPPRTPDSRLSRCTIYTVGEESQGEGGGSGVVGGPELSPSSVSTVGTSILFPSDDEGQS